MEARRDTQELYTSTDNFLVSFAEDPRQLLLTGIQEDREKYNKFMESWIFGMFPYGDLRTTKAVRFNLLNIHTSLATEYAAKNNIDLTKIDFAFKNYLSNL